MAAALQQLRRAIIAKNPITVDDSSIILNDSARLDRSVPTNLRSLHGRGQPYSLEAIYFQYTFRDLPYNDYLQQCNKKGVQHVIAIDKKDLVAYLTGRSDSCAGIVSEEYPSAESRPFTSSTSVKTNIKSESSVKSGGYRPSTSSSSLPTSASLKKGIVGSRALSSSSLADGVDNKDGVNSGIDGVTDGADGGAEASAELFAANRLRVRDQRSIDSVLMVKDWDFTTLREKLFQHVSAARKGKVQPSNSSKGSTASGAAGSYGSQRKSGHSGTAASAAATKTYDPRGDRYTSNDDRFWRENLGSDFQEFGIDMSGSFKAKPTSTSSSQPQPPSSNDVHSQRNSRNPRPSAQHSNQYNQQASHQHPRTSGSVGTNSRMSSSIIKEPPTKRPKTIDPKKAFPIIIVPSGMASIICPSNVVEFLQNGHFMSVDEMREKKVPMTQPARLTMWRKPGGNCSQAQYQIVSYPMRLGKDEWDQVVAVVLTGQSWQFKQWPIFGGKATEMFKKVQGFYFHYDDVAPTGDVNLWAIRKLAFQRDRRHNDGQIQTHFWNILDSFISKNQLPLRY